MAKQPEYNWCSEEEALNLLGFTNKYHLRVITRDEKRKRLDIRTSKPSGRKVLYSKTDIINHINKNATVGAVTF
jgi:hypothetical protein